MNSRELAEKHFPVSKSTLLMHWAIIRKFHCRKSASRWEDKKDGVSQHCYLQSGNWSFDWWRKNLWFAAKQQTIDGILKKTVQTSDAKSVPFLPVFRAYLLNFQQIGSKNKRPDIVCYTTTRKYRELQRVHANAGAAHGYTTTRKYRELQLLLMLVL